MGFETPMQTNQNQEFLILPDGIGKQKSIFGCILASLKEAHSYEDKRLGPGRPLEWSDVLMLHLLLFYVYFDKSWRKTVLELGTLFSLAGIKMPERTTIIKRTNQLSSMFDFVEANRRKTRHKSKSEFYTTSVNVYDVFRGIRSLKSKSDQKVHMTAFDTLLVNLQILPFDTQASEKASFIYSELRQKGVAIDENVYLIAGVYLSNGMDLIVTRDEHFQAIGQLKVVRY